jgi:uncharacterized metal-binding protein YceD (DUF177 family)
VSDTPTSYVSNRILKLQVGFLLNDSAGQSRDYEFDVPGALRVADDLTLNSLNGSIHISHSSRGILVQGTLDTSMRGECSRCLDEASVALTVPVEELYVYPPEPGEISTIAEDGILDIGPLLREEIILNTPIGVLCKPDCAGLCPNCGANLNEGPCDCERDPIDPRLAALRGLISPHRLKDDLSKG